MLAGDGGLVVESFLNVEGTGPAAGVTSSTYQDRSAALSVSASFAATGGCIERGPDVRPVRRLRVAGVRRAIGPAEI
jgi:hypothetical protein